MGVPKIRISGYEFADGARFQGGASKDASAVGKHLEFLRKQQKGELTPEDVIADAKGHNSPLHSFFEWDDGKAAEQHRLAQARGLIRSVVAIYTQPDKPAVRTKAFIHIPEKGTPHYRDAAETMNTAKTRELVLKRAWRELQEWRQRYKDLSEFAAIFNAANEVKEKLPKAATA